MRASTPKKVLRAGFLLFPAVILAAAPAAASSPRCDEPPAPACERVQESWVEQPLAKLERIERALSDLPDLEGVEVERWVELQARVAPILEASTRQLVELRHAPEIEKAREASKHLAWKVRERLAGMGSDSAHPLNPAIQAFVSIAKVPARGIAPLRQALAGVAKAATHVLLALLA